MYVHRKNASQKRLVINYKTDKSDLKRSATKFALKSNEYVFKIIIVLIFTINTFIRSRCIKHHAHNTIYYQNHNFYKL